MPRINHVQKSQKERTCGACRKPIAVGEAYKWAQRYKSPKMYRHEHCAFRPSDLTTSKMGEVWDAQEDARENVASAETPDELRDALEQLAEVVREIGEQYQESCDNIREHFEDSPTAEECEEKAQGLEDWAGELEGESFDEFEPTEFEREEFSNDDGLEGEALEAAKAEHEAEQDRLEAEHEAEQETEAENYLDELRGRAEELVDQCPEV